MKTEPILIPVEADFNRQEIGNNTEGARLDVSCLGIWSPLEKTLMDVRIFHPCAPSYHMSKSIETLCEYMLTMKEARKGHTTFVLSI